MDRIANVNKSVISITVYVPVNQDEKDVYYGIAEISIKTGQESVEYHLTPDCNMVHSKCTAKISNNTKSDTNNELWVTLHKALEDENLYRKVRPVFYEVNYVTITNVDNE